MALTAEQLYQQSLGAQRGRVNQMYGRNLEILAREMRNARERTEASLESRGVLRSSEANTARARLGEEEAAQRRYYGEDRDYQLQQMAMDEQARKLRGAGGPAAPTFIPPVTRSPQQIVDEFRLQRGKRYDPYGLNMRKTFDIRGGMGSRG